jgi:UDP-N-acetylglucosamine 2-epimerase (non-hydrolysing)
MLKVALVVGTRPEAIKMAPIMLELRRHPRTRPVFVLTAQHRELCDDVLEVFHIRPDYDLDVMKPNQSLFQVTSSLVRELQQVLTKEKPDVVLVQGDTTSTFVGALAAYYLRIPVGHVEAGLRTYRKYSPFPEEINRRLTTAIADFHFAPTETAAAALAREAVPKRQIFIVGNPVIDALLQVAGEPRPFKDRTLRRLDLGGRRLVAVTAHRRESWGAPFRGMMQALKRLAAMHPDVVIVFPVHPNPNVRKPVGAILGKCERIVLVEPLDYRDFVKLLQACYFIVTDSGGIQEEAPSLKKPVLVMRDVTERPEAVAAGAVKLVGTDPARILAAADRLLRSKQAYRRMIVEKNPYGDGKTSARIVRIIERELGKRGRAGS